MTLQTNFLVKSSLSFHCSFFFLFLPLPGTYLQLHPSPISSTYLLCQCVSCIHNPVEDRTLHGQILPFTQDLTLGWFLQAAILASKCLVSKPFDPVPAVCLPSFVCAAACHLSSYCRDLGWYGIPNREADMLRLPRKSTILHAIASDKKPMESLSTRNLLTLCPSSFALIFSLVKTPDNIENKQTSALCMMSQ